MQIADFLLRDIAERLAACLYHEVPWMTAERGQPDSPAWDPQTRQKRMPAAYRVASTGFHFVYDRYLIVDAMREGRDTHLLVHQVLRFFNSPPFLAFIRELTGDSELMMVGAQATRYLPGQFLRVHDDRHDEENRRYAYVLNLSRDWQPDWGGLLHFVDDGTGPQEVFVPRFNSLSLFKVPMRHYVSFVAPWARQPRLAITGWWHARPRDPASPA
ncbi:2OG-Fe(II) oxygenase [Fontimonas thermophila]|uniref:2OG-Fe(II) oxygenase n=1 Tax=Fontimonas thermophila TaxID=1076937 RepID=UPI0013563435|nr:2OG-Fe(II) oxygenase family protein [Fontimonas thermophila]